MGEKYGESNILYPNGTRIVKTHSNNADEFGYTLSIDQTVDSGHGARVYEEYRYDKSTSALNYENISLTTVYSGGSIQNQFLFEVQRVGYSYTPYPTTSSRSAGDFPWTFTVILIFPILKKRETLRSAV